MPPNYTPMALNGRFMARIFYSRKKKKMVIQTPKIIVNLYKNQTL